MANTAIRRTERRVYPFRKRGLDEKKKSKKKTGRLQGGVGKVMEGCSVKGREELRVGELKI